MDKDLIKKIFNNPKNRQLIEQNKWTEFYDKIIESDRGDISEFLLNAGINPLLSMNEVPKYFAYRSNIKSIDIPGNIKYIRDSAFSICLGLESVIISNGVTNIGEYAFVSCEMSSIVIPNSVTSIEKYAFHNCKGLTSVTIGNSVTSIGSSAFKSCTGLTNIVIPDSVTSIGCFAFWDCIELRSITIGNNVKSIGGSAFWNCTNLKDITYKGTISQWSEIDKGSFLNNSEPKPVIHCIDGDIEI